MRAREIQDQKVMAGEMGIPAAVYGTAARALERNTISAGRNRRDTALDSAAGNACNEPSDTSLPINPVDVPRLTRALRQLESIAKRQAPRIAIKAKGKILFLDVAEIVAVQAEGNYVSLRHRTNSYLLRERISFMAEKLKPYGFMRIHRSVIVNISAVEEIEPLSTGEYRLRVRGGKEYLVTRTYKDNLRDLAQPSWRMYAHVKP